MRVLLIVILLLSIVGNYPIQNSRLNFLIESYANVSLAIANYFTSACVYLLSSSEVKDERTLNLIKVAKYISSVHGKLNTVATFSEYFKMLNSSSDMGLCYLPLHVIMDNGGDQVRETISFHSNAITGPEQQDGGIWLIFLKSLDRTFIDKYFQVMYTPFDVEIIVAWIGRDQVHMKEIYRVAPGYPLRQPYFGNWSLQRGLKSPEKKMPYTRRSNLEGMEFVVGYRESPPMTIMETDGNKKHASGFIGDIWNVILSAINATSRYVESQEVGVKINDTWTGLLGKLKDREIDIGLTPFIINRDRFDVIEFSHPLFENKFQIFFQQPGSSADADGFLLPFDTDLWLTIGGWLFVGSLFLYLGCRLSDFWLKTEEKLTISESIFTVFNALCCQGSDKVPKTTSNRIIFFLTFIIATIIIPSYSASLVSYLTITDPIIPFTNLEEFYNNNMYRMFVRGGGSYEYDMFGSESYSNNYAYKIFERDLKSNKNLPKSYREAIAQLCQDKHSAFFGIDASTEWNLKRTKNEREKSNCVITKMIKHAGKVNIGLGFPVNSHYKCIINYQIRNLQSIGIDERIRDLYWVKHDDKPRDTWTPVNIGNVFLIFVLFVVGITMSSVIFMVEFILRYKKLATVAPTASNIENNLKEVVIHPSFFNLTSR